MSGNTKILKGGVANAGAVVQQGNHVLRPASEHSKSIYTLLKTVRANDFTGASYPIGIEQDGRERLEFIHGDVATPPYPAWVQSNNALLSVTTLLKQFHDATRQFNSSDYSWRSELADPETGHIMCHNDVCLENVVFRDGKAVALLDFDFAAPGRRVYDLALFARMCIPLDADANAALLGWQPIDHATRLRRVADGYGLTGDERLELFTIVSRSMNGIGSFVKRRLDAGDANFIKMWNDMGGEERFTRRRQWFATQGEHLRAALLA